jgi:N-acetylmuramoyl-L-alanine amidase
VVKSIDSVAKRGRPSIRTFVLALGVALTITTPGLALSAPADPVILLLEGQRREIQPSVRAEVELLPLDVVIAGFGVVVHSDARAGAVTLTYQRREASLYNKKSLASVDGDLRLLSAPAVLEDGQWLVPVDAVPRVIGPLLGKRSEWHSASRVLTLGDVAIPKVGVTTFVSGDLVRVVLEASEKVPFHVVQAEGKVTVSIPRDVVDVSFQQERLTGGIVDFLQYQGGRENVLNVTLGRRFQQMKAYEQDGPPRLVLEFHAAPTTAAARAPRDASLPSPSVTPSPKPTVPGASAGQRTIVIDPGHGGDDTGAKGVGGTLEKDVTLSIARKLRTALVNTLGYQVFLTRDKDEDIPLDERTAVANNYKADLFLSIHANASRSHGATGSEVYFLSYQASDEESRRVAASEGPPPAPGTDASESSGGTDLALILWDMAQAEHLEESSALASRVQEELTAATGVGQRGVKQAPFRVLVGAAMPAALVEVAFISNPEEEKLLASDAFQARVVSAIAKGISRYDGDLVRRAESLGGAGARSAHP